MQFTGDDRGQAVQIGAVLLFGILILGLTIYQATIVPQQNKQVEFDHSQRVQSDMVDVRNSVLRSASTGESTFARVKLGTSYPSRTVAINPSAPSGSLRTVGGGSVTVENGTGTDVTAQVCPAGSVSTRFLEYAPNYNAYDRAPTTVYENTILYNSYESGETLTLTGQRLVDGKTINLLPLVGNYSRSGTGTATFEPIPGFVSGQTVENATITIPTRLSETTWEELLASELSASAVNKSNGNLVLKPPGKYTVRCSPVGAGQPPKTGARSTAPILSSSGGQGSLGQVNPAGPDAVSIWNVTSPTSKRIDLEFVNHDEKRNRTIKQMRIPFLSGGRHTPRWVATVNGTTDTTLTVTGDYEALNDPIEIRKNSGGFDNTQTVEITFDNGVQGQWLIVSVVFANGEQANYYVVAK